MMNDIGFYMIGFGACMISMTISSSVDRHIGGMLLLVGLLYIGLSAYLKRLRRDR